VTPRSDGMTPRPGDGITARPSDGAARRVGLGEGDRGTTSGSESDGAPGPGDVASLLRSSARASVWLPVDGVSMLPTISAGSQVRVKAQARGPRIAEIWAFCDTNGLVVVHRYRRRGPQRQSVFRGDNVPWHDPPVDESRLIGRVTHVRRGNAIRRIAISERLRWIGRRLWQRILRDTTNGSRRTQR